MRQGSKSTNSERQVRLMPSPSGEVSYVMDCKCPTSSASATPARDWGKGAQAEEHLRGAGIVILAHNRDQDLKLCLSSLAKNVDVGLFKVVVSLDNAETRPAMRKAVESVERDSPSLKVDVWEVPPRVFENASYTVGVKDWMRRFVATSSIAYHYKWAFDKAFVEVGFEYAIFLEEDLVLAPDFLSLFRSTAWLLVEDPSLWCISAWNDVGFTATFNDNCRLLRTSYFPGLGFLLPKRVYLEMRKEWPAAPTMGWDYWTRVFFRTHEKECVIPEVPRSRHLGRGGSSVKTAKQSQYFDSLGLAAVESSCGPGLAGEAPCRQFGDVSYLIDAEYEKRVLAAVAAAHPISDSDLRSIGKRGGPPQKSLYLLPYRYESFKGLRVLVGLHPKDVGAYPIPPDVRSEHYGLVVAKHVESGSWVLLVDCRSTRNYCPENLRLKRNLYVRPVAANKGENCVAACGREGGTCDDQQLHLLNNCHDLKSVFPCEEGCAHQVGMELPAYVTEPREPTYRQCLVTFMATLNCVKSHAHTSRLCACVGAANPAVTAPVKTPVTTPPPANPTEPPTQR